MPTPCPAPTPRPPRKPRPAGRPSSMDAPHTAPPQPATPSTPTGGPAPTGNGVHLVQDHEAPLLGAEPLHDPLSLPGPLGGVAQHGVGADGNGAADGLVLGVGGEAADLAVVDGGPHLELGFPLLHRHGRVAKHQTALPDRARSRHPNQGLPRTCGTAKRDPQGGAERARHRTHTRARDLQGPCPLHRETCPLSRRVTRETAEPALLQHLHALVSTLQPSHVPETTLLSLPLQAWGTRAGHRVPKATDRAVGARGPAPSSLPAVTATQQPPRSRKCRKGGCYGQRRRRGLGSFCHAGVDPAP